MNYDEQQMILAAMVEQLEAMKNDPNSSEKDKVSMLSSLLLAVLRSEFDAQQRAMLPAIINVTMMQIKSEFNELPKDVIVAQYDALLASKLPIDMVEEKFDEALATVQEQFFERFEGREPKTPMATNNSVNFDMDRYNFEAYREMDEDEFVEFRLGFQSFFPARLVASFMQGADGAAIDLEARARSHHAMLRSYETYEEYVRARGDQLISEELAQEAREFVVSFVKGLDGEKLYNATKDIVENFQAHQAIKLYETGLSFAEEFLEAGQRGNLYRFENTGKATKFRDAAAVILQILEDALVDNDLIPDTNLPMIYAQATADMEARLKASSGVEAKPSNPNLKTKGKGARGLQPRR